MVKICPKTMFTLFSGTDESLFMMYIDFEITLFSGLNGVDFKSKDVQSCLSSPAIGLLPADSYPDDLIGCIAWQKIIQ